MTLKNEILEEAKDSITREFKQQTYKCKHI